MVSYLGKCFCGSVEIQVDGNPNIMAICHCKVCRAWSAGPVNGAALWTPDKFTIIFGEEQLDSYAKNPGHDRTWCKKCGGHIFTDHSNSLGFFDVYASILEDFNFKPTMHLNYENTIIKIPDDLPKFVDYPKEMGGSGNLIE